MKRHESEKGPKLLSARELVDLMADAGPGASMPVRIHLKNGESKVGRAKWHDDRVNGPVVVIPDLKNEYNESLILLGGDVMFDSPPKRISSLTDARTLGSIPKGELKAHERPINPMAENYMFEIIQE